MFAKTAAFVFNVALPMLLVRRLDKAQFGVYRQLFLVIGTSVMVLPLGFAMSAYYFLPREPDRRQGTVLNILIYNMAVGTLACGVLLLWPVLLGIIFDQPGLAGYAHLIGVVILLWIVSQTLEIIPIANGEMKLASALIIGVQLTRTAIYLAAVLAFGSVRALIWAAVVQGGLQTVVLWWYLQSRFGRFWRHPDWGLMRRQLSYAVPLGLAGILFVVQTDLHSYFVSNRLGPVAYAIYGIGTVQLPLMGMLQEATNAVVIPRVSLLQQQNDTREIMELMARAMRKLAAVYFPVYALMVVVAHEFISFLFTRSYLASVPVFLINLTLLLLGIVLQDPLFRAYVEQRFFLIRLRVVLCVLLTAGPLGGDHAIWHGGSDLGRGAGRRSGAGGDGDTFWAHSGRYPEGYRAAERCRKAGPGGSGGGLGDSRGPASAARRKAVDRSDGLRHRVFPDLQVLQ
jgi:O-antigen/teichoic acid export membrane protein